MGTGVTADLGDSRSTVQPAWGPAWPWASGAQPCQACSAPPGPGCSWLQLLPPVFCSRVRRLPDNGDSQMSSQEQPSEGSEAEPAGAQWPCGEPEDSTAPAVGPAASLAPLATRSPHLASSCSPGLLTSKVCVHSDLSGRDSQPLEPFPRSPSPSPPNSTHSEPCFPPLMTSFVPPPSPTPTHTQRDSMALRLGTLP